MSYVLNEEKLGDDRELFINFLLLILFLRDCEGRPFVDHMILLDSILA